MESIHIDENGDIFEAGYKNFSPIGRVDEDGNVYEGRHSFSPIGRVDEDGNVYDHSYSRWSSVERANDLTHGVELLLSRRNYETEQSYNENTDEEMRYSTYVEESHYYSRPSQNSEPSLLDAIKDANMRDITIFTIIWAVFALIIGWIIYIIDPTMSVFYIPGIMLMISGLFAAVTAVLVFLKRFHIIAVTTCIISAIFGLAIVIGFYGFTVAHSIAKAKGEFAD